MNEFFDVAIVGGSAIGGVAAAECAKRGLKTVILEEDPVVGKFRRCTSICSESGLRSTGVPFSDSILNYVHGAVFHSQSKELTVKLKETLSGWLDGRARRSPARPGRARATRRSWHFGRRWAGWSRGARMRWRWWIGWPVRFWSEEGTRRALRRRKGRGVDRLTIDD